MRLIVIKTILRSDVNMEKVLTAYHWDKIKSTALTVILKFAIKQVVKGQIYTMKR